ncbi:MAG: RNA polymerase sigma factor [Terriglobia bacterium]
MQSDPQDAQEVDWVRRAQNGDHEAFGLLVERYQRRVFSIAFHIVRQRDETEDLAQEIFLKVFRAIRSYNWRASFGTWVARIAVNHCYDYLRRQRSSRLSYQWQLSEEALRALESAASQPHEGAPNLDEQIAWKDLAQKLLDRAPPEDRIVLTLKEIEDLSVEEIAETLDWTASKVKVRLHRARKRMLADLKRWRKGGRSDAL